MQKNTIVGWILLAIGLLIIFWVLVVSYNIFSGRSTPPEFFQTEEMASSEEGMGEETAVSKNELEEMEKILEDQIKEFLPVDQFPDFFNLIVWTMFASIMIFGGSKISGIGIKLIGTSKEVS